MKNKIHKPKTTQEAIDDLQQFLECDLYSKFRPETEIKGEVWSRVDPFKDEEEFSKYLDDHFNILRKEIESLTHGKGKQEVKNG